MLAIVRVPSRDAPEWNGFDDAVTSLGKADAAIIDLRGNGGGDDARGYQAARALVDGPVQTGVLRTHLRQTPETLTLLLNTLEVLRRHPPARVFGERTAGYIHFGDVGSLTLPHSGIRLGIPTTFHEHPNDAFYDKVGFEPDVTVAPGHDAFDAALEWLKPM